MCDFCPYVNREVDKIVVYYFKDHVNILCESYLFQFMCMHQGNATKRHKDYVNWNIRINYIWCTILHITLPNIPIGRDSIVSIVCALHFLFYCTMINEIKKKNGMNGKKNASENFKLTLFKSPFHCTSIDPIR